MSLFYAVLIQDWCFYHVPKKYRYRQNRYKKMVSWPFPRGTLVLVESRSWTWTCVPLKEPQWECQATTPTDLKTPPFRRLSPIEELALESE